MIDSVMILMGVVLLTLGRKLFWLLVAAVGFFIGLRLAPQIIHSQSELVILLVAVVAGLLGAWLATSLQKFAVGLSGFLAGGYLASSLLNTIKLDTGSYGWLVFIIGGLLGALLVGLLFEWALIILSSLIGAILITQVINPGIESSALMYLLLAVGGILFQIYLMRGVRKVIPF